MYYVHVDHGTPVLKEVSSCRSQFTAKISMKNFFLNIKEFSNTPT